MIFVTKQANTGREVTTPSSGSGDTHTSGIMTFSQWGCVHTHAVGVITHTP